MAALSLAEATSRLATIVENAAPSVRMEIFAELFPTEAEAPVLSASDLAQHVRSGLAAEELVDLWNVVYPADRNVWYNEEDEKIHYNEHVIGYAEAD
jgi:hypothetical protein